ncbi:hypothetical protein CASFOL_024620 [Castilleja foliolosa]|uniref:Uncharacterized protein n=1 Tax=Castilleja foliolosa TaxID=1961234 RepID=A0ABD3CQP2_9LAMI
MSTVFQLQGKQSLPVSHPQERKTVGASGLIRRRLSSISLNLKIQPSSTSSWTFQRPKSIAYAGSSIRKWWGWGCDWILSRKPTFATDLEMNDDEIAAIGNHNKGSWRHVFYKVTSQLRRKLIGSDNVVLPQTFRYKSFN